MDKLYSKTVISAEKRRSFEDWYYTHCYINTELALSGKQKLYRVSGSFNRITIVHPSDVEVRPSSRTKIVSVEPYTLPSVPFDFNIRFQPREWIRLLDGSWERVVLHNYDDVADWMYKRFPENGIEILSLDSMFRIRLRASTKKLNGLLHATEVKGLVKVTDPEKAMSFVTKGIGRARAFGFGLLLVKKEGAREESI